MLKGWKPVVEDITEEIARLKMAISDAKFNSDFGSKMQIIKIRTVELSERLNATVKEMRSQAHAERAMIDLDMAEFLGEVNRIHTELARIRIFRAQRSRDNYLHIMDLKAQSAPEGGEA